MNEHDANQRQTDATGLVASASAAGSGKAFLGDISVIDRLLRDLASGVLDRFVQVGSGEIDPGEASSEDQEACHLLARILIGQDDDYIPINGWSDGALAGSIRHKMKEAVHPNEDDVSVVAQAIAVFVHSIYLGIKDLENDSKTRATQDHINESIRSFSYLLLGIDQHD